MSLSLDDVQRIVRLLDASQFDELRLEADGIKLHLVRHGAASGTAPSTAPQTQLQVQAQAQAPAGPAAAEGPVATPAVAPPVAAPQPGGMDALSAGLVDIRAPMLGTFYCAPKPGAAPFVAVGTRVEADSPIGVIEVMKLMNAIPAGVAGEVVEVLVRDAVLVEFDQPLMRVRLAA